VPVTDPPLPPELSGGGGVDPLVLGGLAATVGIAMLLGLLARNARRDRLRHGPAFRRLAGHLGLSRRERRLVRDAARLSRIATPATLLVSTGALGHAAERMRRRQPRHAAALAALQARIASR
jgi:hypothetical protein